MYTDTLMLTTVGAKSKQLRRSCLPFFRDGDDLVVRGTNGGGPTDPGWVHNIRANPEVCAGKPAKIPLLRLRPCYV